MAEQGDSSTYAPPVPVQFDPAADGDPSEDKREIQQYEQNGTQNGARRVVHQPTVSQVAQPVFTKLANPGPLGLLSFAITTFVVGLYECGAGYAPSHHLSYDSGLV